jgi:hypothetical protein
MSKEEREYKDTKIQNERELAVPFGIWSILIISCIHYIIIKMSALMVVPI